MRLKLLPQTDQLLSELNGTTGANPLRQLAVRAGVIAHDEGLAVAGSLQILRACLLQLANRLDDASTEDDWRLAQEEITALVVFVRDPSNASLEQLGMVSKRKRLAPGSNSLN